MITALEAIEMSNVNDKMWVEFQKEQDAEIKRACECGLRRACWIGWHANYSRNEDAYKERYRKQGYTFKPIGFKPIGMCGGVWQPGEYICW